jgi:hypothetical protein
MAENRKPTLKEMIIQLNLWHGEVKNFRNDGYTQEGYRKKIAAMRTNILRITEDIRNSEELTGEDGTGPGTSRSLSNRYSGDPRDKDS